MSVVVYVLLSFGLCIVAVGVVMATTTRAGFEREREEASTRLTAAATYTADLEDDALAQVGGVLGGLAQQESIAKLDPATCASTFEGLASVSAQGSLYLLRPDGSVVCSLLAKRAPRVDVPKGEWFERAKASPTAIYGGLRVQQPEGVPQAIYAAPVPSPTGVGVLVGVLDTTQPPLEVPAGGPKQTVIIELNTKRNLVVATSRNDFVKPGPIPAGSWLARPLGANHERVDPDGVTRLYEQVVSQQSGRIVLAGVPKNVALYEAVAERNQQILLGLAILALVGVLGAVVQRQIARPLASLRHAIHTAGEDGTVKADNNGPSEIAALADEFNRTMAKRRQLECDLSKSVARAEEASRMKSRFLANVSHEIRTPLNGVLGMIGLFRDEGLTPTQRDYLDTIDNSASALMAILNDLLDFSKIEAGMVAVDEIEFPLQHCVRAAVAPWGPVAKQKGVLLTTKLDPGLPSVVFGDPSRFRQVLSNLVDNAVKFTASGEVKVTVTAPDPGWIRVEVQDTGVGLGESTEHLFDAFVQGDPSTTRRFGGTGLGLAICKQTVAMLHGRINANGRSEGTGAVFRFEVPLATVAHAPATCPSDDADLDDEIAGCRGRVLLAEDNPVNQKVARAMIERLGYAVDVVDNGREAVAQVQRERYVAVLMDLQMPEMDGLDATIEIRERLGCTVPVYALSASVLAEDQERCLAAGMNGHLGKPIVRDALRAALAEAAEAAGEPGAAAAAVA